MSPRRILLSVITIGIFGFASTSAFSQAAGARGENFLYKVMAGDTLGMLAGRYTTGLSNWTALQTFNKVVDPARLPIGLLLKIPFALIPELPSNARVNYFTGQAHVNGQALQALAQVSEGQTIETGPNGFVTLQLDDGSLLSIPASSSLTMSRLRVFKGTRLTDSIIEVKEGTVESKVAPENTGVGRFEVRTPVSVTGVRGTYLRVHVSAQGTRSEVLDGGAEVDGAHWSEVALHDKQGVAVNSAGENLGVRDLLPAPDLVAPERGSGGWSMSFPPVPGANAYLVRVASDPAGVNLASSQTFSSAAVQFSAPGPGTYHVFVRAIDDMGIGGVDAQQSFEGRLVLQGSDGTPILSGFGLHIAVADY